MGAESDSAFGRTEVRKKFGLEAAASLLGHTEIGVTQVYAEADRQRAIEVVRNLG